MKSILISIKPEWVDKILKGEKTVEIRKTYPHCGLPCKVYIYCAKGKTLYQSPESNEYLEYYSFERWNDKDIKVNGKVVAEFTLNTLEEYEFELHDNDTFESIGDVWYNAEGDRLVDIIATDDYVDKTEIIRQAQLNIQQLRDYFGKGFHSGYAWYINNLLIYDTPKELSEFIIYKKCNSCEQSGYESSGCMYDEHCKIPTILTRPPQSWCYVEEC